MVARSHCYGSQDPIVMVARSHCYGRQDPIVMVPGPDYCVMLVGGSRTVVKI